MIKKISVIFTALFISVSLLLSCKNTEKQKKEVATESHQPKHKGPPPGDRKGPPPGDRNGPPPHGERKGTPRGGGPVQTKTIEEIGGYQIGDVATDFSLKNVDGAMISLAGIENAKGYVVVFTCNECPFSEMYEDRLNDINNTYAPKGYPVVAINPNSPENEKEGYEAMQQRAKEKGFLFPYLVDEGQKIYPQYGAVRTPHVFLLNKDLKVQYIGTIDDNAKDPEAVKVKYLENAIEALQNNKQPNPSITKAIGCSIKASKA